MFMVDKEATGRDCIEKMQLCEGGRSILVEEREREREREREGRLSMTGRLPATGQK